MLNATLLSLLTSTCSFDCFYNAPAVALVGFAGFSSYVYWRENPVPSMLGWVGFPRILLVYPSNKNVSKVMRDEL
jgi:hypothetical protein